MPDPIQGQNGRPAGVAALTPDQIAAAQTAVPVVPVAPAAVAPVAPAVVAPVAPVAAAVAPAANFNVGSFNTGTFTPEQIAQENASLKKQMAQNAVYAAAGGQEEFAAMSEWATTGRTAEKNAELNAALNNPNVPDNLRAMAVTQAMNEFKAATGAPGTQAPGTLITGEAGITPGANHGVTPAVQPITEGDYQGRYIALRKAGKDNYAPEMVELEKQRMAGLAANTVK